MHDITSRTTLCHEKHNMCTYTTTIMLAGLGAYKLMCYFCTSPKQRVITARPPRAPWGRRVQAELTVFIYMFLTQIRLLRG